MQQAITKCRKIEVIIPVTYEAIIMLLPKPP